jgi:hypothetical protein
MTVTITWIAALATLLTLMVYEVALALEQRRDPQRLSRSAHASLREEWFAAVSAQSGSEILAVQALRNSLMSATMTASTAVLGLLGTITLAAPTLRTSVGELGVGDLAFTPRLVIELTLMMLLFASLLCSAMAVRYYNHASFICAMPVGSPGRQKWSANGAAYVRRAGILYSWGLRHLLLVAPVVAFILHPMAGPVTAIGMLIVLRSFDHITISGADQSPTA